MSLPFAAAEGPQSCGVACGASLRSILSEVGVILIYWRGLSPKHRALALSLPTLSFIGMLLTTTW